jgi:hypothetical protein
MDETRHDEPSDEEIVAEYDDIPEPLADLERAYHAVKEQERLAQQQNAGEQEADEGRTRGGCTT